MFIPISVWGQIAPRMQNKELAAMLAAPTQEQSDQQLEAWAKEKVGSNDPMLLQAFLDVAPLLVENVAISHWTARNPQWKDAMPEVLTVAEAAQVAQADYLLDATQTRQLIEQLKTL